MKSQAYHSAPGLSLPRFACALDPRYTTLIASNRIMRKLVHMTIAAGTALALLFPAAAQTYRPPRAADGHADLSGVYQALNSANWDLEDHSAAPGTMWQTGAIGS